MRSTAITMVLGVCGVLAFGCAEMKAVEKEASSGVKEAEKSGALKDVEKKVEDKAEGKSAKSDAKSDKSDKAADTKSDAGSADEKSVTAAVASHGGVKAAVSGNGVTLTGKVATAKDKADAEAAVKKVHGVSSVTNNISVGK